MNFARFTVGRDKDERAGVVTNETVKEIRGDIFTEWEYTGNTFAVEQVRFLAPLVPHSIIGIGANYLAPGQARPETLPEIPVFFFKPLTSVIGTDEDIVIPPSIDEVKFESELAVIIGKEAYQIKESEVSDYIFGYTIGNDVTAPQYFHPDGHWTIGKSFKTFTPLGPVIKTDLDLANIRIQAIHNGEMKQDGTTDLMIISIPRMIAYLANVFPLMPGDVILTGAPTGADFLKKGDVIECTIEEIGVLRNKVR